MSLLAIHLGKILVRERPDSTEFVLLITATFMFINEREVISPSLYHIFPHYIFPLTLFLKSESKVVPEDILQKSNAGGQTPGI